MSRSLYTLLDINDEHSNGPIHERIATVYEVVRGHTCVLAEFRRQPGRWLLWIDVDNAPCPDCGENAGRYVQFAFLEDGTSLIGECSASHFLCDHVKFTPEQEDALRALGWQDPIEGRTPNFHVEVTTDEGVLQLGQITEETLLDVFGLGLRDRAVIKFQERILHRRTS